MKKFPAIIIASALCALPAFAAQDDDDFNKFMKESMSDFNSFISEANKEFISFMRNPWTKFNSEKPVEKRIVPEPEKLPVYDPVADPAPDSPRELSIEDLFNLTTKEGSQKPVTDLNGGKAVGNDSVTPPAKPVTPPAKPVTPPAKPVTPPAKKVTPPVKPVTPPAKKVTPPVTPVTPPAKPAVPPVKPAVPKTPASPLYSGGAGRERINYAGIDYHVSNALRGRTTLNSLTENDIADAYENLFRADWKPLVEDLTALQRNDLRNEWALFMVIKKISERFAGKNESIVLRQFLLNQLGYKARIARVNNNRLSLFVAPDTDLYGCIYLDLNRTRFYDVDANQPYTFYMCRKDSPSATKKVSMKVKAFPRTGENVKSSVHQTAKATVRADVPVGLMEFYNDLPQCEYDVYANAPVYSGVESAVLPSLKAAIEGKDEQTAAGILLDFCQNGFKYATDDQQFGYEKPFFIEELFYYPMCDCEDRSILYRYLVKKLLGLDVVLLDYPGHIATAVRFNSPVNGDYITYNGNRYTICDPTYINARIGMAMPQYRSTPAKVLPY